MRIDAGDCAARASAGGRPMVVWRRKALLRAFDPASMAQFVWRDHCERRYGVTE
ncbi:MAG: hypothetical protein U1E61_17925 [Bradyrhizobium sp.]